jgi:hypothetical protein
MSVNTSYIAKNCLIYTYYGFGNFATGCKLFSTTNLDENTALVEFNKTE